MRTIEAQVGRFLPLIILSGLLATAFEGLGLGMLAPLLTLLEEGADMTGRSGLWAQLGNLARSISPQAPVLPLLGVVLGLVGLKAISQIGNSSITSYIEGAAGYRIRQCLAEKVAALDYSFFLQTMALVGPSGSGKSTLLNLLCGLLSPTSGSIAISGRDVQQGGLKLWRSHVGLAGQDTDLIHGSVLDNIRYGMPDATADDVVEAAEAAGVDRFIRRLPMGYSTALGPVGRGLSGGQRQRIGIARAVLHRPELLILDEATSAVDAESESVLLRSLFENRPFGRAILVSHQRSALRSCDGCVVLEAGRVIEVGPFATSEWLRDAR